MNRKRNLNYDYKALSRNFYQKTLPWLSGRIVAYQDNSMDRNKRAVEVFNLIKESVRIFASRADTAFPLVVKATDRTKVRDNEKDSCKGDEISVEMVNLNTSNLIPINTRHRLVVLSISNVHGVPRLVMKVRSHKRKPEYRILWGFVPVTARVKSVLTSLWIQRRYRA